MRERLENYRKPVIGRQIIFRSEALNLAMIFISERLFLFVSFFFS